MSEKARMYDAIELQAVQQWERAKGEMQALIALLGCVPSEYNGNTAIRGRHYEELASEFDAFVKKVEHNDWHLPDRR